MASLHQIIIFFIVICTLCFVSAVPLETAVQVHQQAPQGVIASHRPTTRLIQRHNRVVTRLKTRQPSVRPIQYSISPRATPLAGSACGSCMSHSMFYLSLMLHPLQAEMNRLLCKIVRLSLVKHVDHSDLYSGIG